MIGHSRKVSCASAVRSATILLAVFALSGVGCGGKFKSDSEVVAESYFDAMKRNDVDAALTLYAPAFFEATPAEKWRVMLINIHSKLGDLQSHSLLNWTAGAMTGAPKTMTLRYQVKYARYDATETIVLVHSADDAKVRIIGHHIESDGLLME